MNAFKGYRTFIFNIIMGAAALYTQMTGVDVNTGGIIENLTSLEGFVTELWIGGNLLLRKFTDTAIFKDK